MDYAKRLEQSINNFELEANKLSQINQLIQNSSKLIDEVAKEKEILEKSIEHLLSLKNKISIDCETLSKYTMNEESARNKLINDVHDTVIKDSKKIIDDLSTPLISVKTELLESCNLLTELIETHKKTQESFLSEIEGVLVKYNTKNLEVYNIITSTISNKIDVSKNDLETSVTLNFNKIVNNLSNLSNNFKSDISNLSKDTEKLNSDLSNELKQKSQMIFNNIDNLNNNIKDENSNLSDKLIKESQTISNDIDSLRKDIKSLYENTSSLNYIKMAVTIATCLGAASCIIGFLK